MNLEEMKKSGVNKIQILDALMAPLLQLKISVTGETTIPEEKNLKIFIDDNELDTTNRKTIVYPLKRKLEPNETITIESKFIGNKIKMNATVKRVTKEEPANKEITVGSDLSGKMLILNFPTQLGTNGNYYPGLFKSEKYLVREQYNNGINVIEIQEIATTDIIDVLYQDETINLESYQLPEDFGVVTEVIDRGNQFAGPLTYIKYLGTNVVSSEITEETLNYIPVVLKAETNIITTNYQNAKIDLVYPKNNDLVKYFLTSPLSFSFNNEDKFLTLDDIYFKDCFTELEENLINAVFNKLTIKCMNSANNNFSLDCDGNLVVNSITTKIKNESDNDLTYDKIYPIGSIYMSAVNTNPSTIFGGTWVQIKDRFLLSAGDTYTVLQTGGESTHTLTVNEMPSHEHREKGDMHWAYDQIWIGNGSSTTLGWPSDSIYTDATGGNEAHNNMPPYLVVYMWRRTA